MTLRVELIRKLKDDRVYTFRELTRLIGVEGANEVRVMCGLKSRPTVSAIRYRQRVVTPVPVREYKDWGRVGDRVVFK